MALLLIEPVELLQTIVDKYFVGDKARELSSDLLSVTQFLKYTYSKHIKLSTLEWKKCTCTNDNVGDMVDRSLISFWHLARC